MKILFVSPSFPNRLHRIRAWQLIQILAKRHEVHVATLAFSPPPQAEFEELSRLCASVTVVRKSYLVGLIDAASGLFMGLPLEVAFCRSSVMCARVEQLVREKEIDLVYIKRLRSAQFVNPRTPNILDSTDAMSLFYEKALEAPDLARKLFHWYEGKAYKRYERWLTRFYKEWVVCSSVDAAHFTKTFPQIRVSVVPNGVDTEYYVPTTRNPDVGALLVTGLFTKFVNIEAASFFVHKIFPLILNRKREARLYLVGPSGFEVRRLAGPNIFVTGKVKDIRESIAEAMVVCVPVLTGTGTRNKILQAWAIGRPVVSTPEGAEGLSYTDGEDILIGRTPEEFAAHVVKLLSDSELRARLVAKGKTLVDNTYALSVIGKDLESVLTRAEHA